MEKDLKLIVMKGAKPLGEKVDSYLKKAFNTDNTFIVDTQIQDLIMGKQKPLLMSLLEMMMFTFYVI